MKHQFGLDSLLSSQTDRLWTDRRDVKYVFIYALERPQRTTRRRSSAGPTHPDDLFTPAKIDSPCIGKVG